LTGNLVWETYTPMASIAFSQFPEQAFFSDFSFSVASRALEYHKELFKG